MSCLLVLFFLLCLSLCSPIFCRRRPPRRPCAGIFFLVFVLFRPCSSYLFLFSTCVVLAAFLIFFHHISSELLSASFFLFFCLFRPYAGIFFLVFVLFRPCSSYLFLFNTYVVLLAALLILHHIRQNSCRLFCLFSYFSYLLVWFVLLCSRTWYDSISLALPWLIAVVLVFLCLTVCVHEICISLRWRISTDIGCTDVAG